MKKFVISAAVLSFALSACAHMQPDNKMDDAAAEKPKAESMEVTCKEGDPGFPRCTTGGGATGGPVLRDSDN
jgi:hypothetical protein